MTESELKTRAMAARVMKIADSHSTNGKLSRTELESTLGTTEFAPFLGWLTKDGGVSTPAVASVPPPRPLPPHPPPPRQISRDSTTTCPETST